MSLGKCVVPGCEVNSVPRHRFPNFKKDFPRFQLWLDILQVESLNGMQPEDIYQKKLICHNHFEDKYISPGTKRLHVNAVPTLFISNGLPSGSGKVLVSSEQVVEMPSCSFISEEEECVAASGSVPLNSNYPESNAQILLEHSYSRPLWIYTSSSGDDSDSESTEMKVEDVETVEQFDVFGVHDKDVYMAKMEYNNVMQLPQQTKEGAFPFLKTDGIYEEDACDNNIHENGSEKLTADDSLPDLKQHVESVHLKQHKCDFCNYASNRKQYLKVHVDFVHLNLKEHKCNLCDYETCRKDSLKRHVDYVHLNQRQHKCSFCDYASNQKQNLKQHVKNVHLNVKGHKCNLCDYKASRNTDLKRHVDSVHLNRKKYKCVLCDYASNQKQNLKVHVDSVHWNLKEHKCNLCDFASNQRHHLKAHVDSVHLNLKLHKCDLCDYSANSRYTLKVHVNSVHLNLKKHKCDS